MSGMRAMAGWIRERRAARWSFRRGSRDRGRERGRCPAHRTRSRCRSAGAAARRKHRRQSRESMRERRQATTQETHDKDDEARRSDCLVDGLHLWVVEALADALGAHDDAAQVAQALDLLERLDDLLARDAGDERERAERKQALLRLCRVRRRRGSLFRTVRLAVLLHVVVEHSGRVDGLGGSRKSSHGLASDTTETSIPCVSMNLTFSARSQYCGPTGLPLLLAPFPSSSLRSTTISLPSVSLMTLGICSRRRIRSMYDGG